MDDAELDREQRQHAWAAVRARSHQLLAQCEAQRRAEALQPSRDPDMPDALARWAANMPRPEPRNEYLDLFQQIEALGRELRELRSELAGVRAEAAAAQAATLAMADEAGKISGKLGREIDRLRKRVEGKPKA